MTFTWLSMSVLSLAGWTWRLLRRAPSHLKLLVLLLLFAGLATLLSSLVLLGLAFFGHRLRARNEARRRWALSQLGLFERPDAKRRLIAGFFHPYCNAGGGGERVLWTAIACMQREEPDLICLVYAGDASEAEKLAILDKVKTRFGIDLVAERLLLVHLPSVYLVEDSTWPRFTLLGQSIGSIFLALEGLRKGAIPDIWLDTMGYAFAYPFVRSLCRVPIGSYTHYPTISSDMLGRVSRREAGHTNTDRVAKSAFLSSLKLVYYLLFSELYSWSLRRADVLMVNSSWTKNHIDYMLKPLTHRDDVDDPLVSDASDAETATGQAMGTGSETLRQRRPASREQATTTPTHTPLKARQKARIVFPPCDTRILSALPLEVRENVILSVAQFRPEKEHQIQLEAFKLFLVRHPRRKTGRDAVKFVMAGSVRNDEDSARVESLRELARQYDVADNVEFAVNVSYDKLVKLFGRASVGMHTMVDEHFGITVVEFQAAGLIPLVHASAGPLLDIVVPYEGRPTGFHAKGAQEFADRLEVILETLDDETKIDLRRRARQNAGRFSKEVFERAWMDEWARLEGMMGQRVQ